MEADLLRAREAEGRGVHPVAIFIIGLKNQTPFLQSSPHKESITTKGKQTAHSLPFSKSSKCQTRHKLPFLETMLTLKRFGLWHTTLQKFVRCDEINCLQKNCFMHMKTQSYFSIFNFMLVYFIFSRINSLLFFSKCEGF